MILRRNLTQQFSLLPEQIQNQDPSAVNIDENLNTLLYKEAPSTGNCVQPDM